MWSPQPKLILIGAMGHFKPVPHDMNVFEMITTLIQAIKKNVCIWFFPAPLLDLCAMLLIRSEASNTFIEPSAANAGFY